MYLYLPVIYSDSESPSDGFHGPPVTDPGTIYVVREESVEEDWPDSMPNMDEIVVQTTIKELVLDCLGAWAVDGMTAEEHFEASDALAAMLREAADLVDTARPRLKT